MQMMIQEFLDQLSDIHAQASDRDRLTVGNIAGTAWEVEPFTGYDNPWVGVDMRSHLTTVHDSGREGRISWDYDHEMYSIGAGRCFESLAEAIMVIEEKLGETRSIKRLSSSGSDFEGAISPRKDC